MSPDEVPREQGLIAEGLAEVAWPWDATNASSQDLEQLSGEPTEISAALRSLRAMLQFRAVCGRELSMAYQAVPELAETYWIAWRHDLTARMPRMTDLTWENFWAWARDFEPAWIGMTWTEVPPEFVHAAAWIWSNGRVRLVNDAVVRWLVRQFADGGDGPLLDEFLEICVTYAPKVGDYGGALISVVSQLGGKSTISYLDRIAVCSTLSESAKEALEFRRELAIQGLRRVEWRGLVNVLLYELMFRHAIDEAAVIDFAEYLVSEPVLDLAVEDEYRLLVEAVRSGQRLTGPIDQPHSEDVVRDFLNDIIRRMDDLRPWPLLPYRSLATSSWEGFLDSKLVGRIRMRPVKVEERIHHGFRDVSELGREFSALVLLLQSGERVALAAPWWAGSRDVAILYRGQASEVDIVTAFIEATGFSSGEVEVLSC
jgi:hypothetical protein